MDRDIVSVLQDLLNRQSLEKPIFRVQYSIEDKNVEKVVFGDDFNVGRLDESDPSAAKGIALPPSVRGTHMMRGAFSRKVLKILKGVVNIPPSANRVWLTRKKDWFYQHTAVDIWNVDTQRDGQIWHHLQPKLWLPTFLLFAWFAKTIFPQSVINMIGKILMQELKKSLTLQPFESQVSLGKFCRP